MKFCRTFLAVLLAVLFSSLAPVAQAQGHGRMHEHGQRQERQPERAQQHAAPERQQRQEEREPRQNLSPEERKQLRRDVDDAGRELYRRPPEGRR